MKKTNNLIPLALNIQHFSALFYCLFYIGSVSVSFIGDSIDYIEKEAINTFNRSKIYSVMF